MICFTSENFQISIFYRWFSNCRLLRDVYHNQPLVPAALQYIVENRKLFENIPLPQQRDMVLFGILPRVLDADILTTTILVSKNQNV